MFILCLPSLYASSIVKEEYVESCFLQTTFLEKVDNVIESVNCVKPYTLLKVWRKATCLGLWSSIMLQMCCQRNHTHSMLIQEHLMCLETLMND